MALDFTCKGKYLEKGGCEAALLQASIGSGRLEQRLDLHFGD